MSLVPQSDQKTRLVVKIRMYLEKLLARESIVSYLLERQDNFPHSPWHLNRLNRYSLVLHLPAEIMYLQTQSAAV